MSDPANQRKLDAADQLAQLADEVGIPLVQVAIAFVLRHPAITAAIIGPRTMKHLDSQLAAIDVALSDEVLDRIRSDQPARGHDQSPRQRVDPTCRAARQPTPLRTGGEPDAAERRGSKEPRRLSANCFGDHLTRSAIDVKTRELLTFGLGVFQTPPEETRAAVRAALGVGYRHVDTAAAYGNERQIGDAVHSSHLDPSEVFLETKIWISDYGYAETLPVA